VQSRLAVVLVSLAAVVLAVPGTAVAWKPYTHNYTGFAAYQDAADNGSVTIAGRDYRVPEQVRRALIVPHAAAAYYNAGVVGPDGFPDMTFGQSVIHPQRTGAWLDYVLDRANAAQKDTTYTPAERQQILAFAYGFLTHAAGDMWGHTLVNDLSRGLFPSPRQILNGSRTLIAVRHYVAESYVGAATPGWDSGAPRGPVCTGPPPPGTICDDISDEHSRGVEFEAPTRFIYETFIDPVRSDTPWRACGDRQDDDSDGSADDGCPSGPYTVGKPEVRRGFVIDGFLDLQADLQVAAKRYQMDAADDKCMVHCGPAVEKEVIVNTVRGRRSAKLKTRPCADQKRGCIYDFDDLKNNYIYPYVSAYFTLWAGNIANGLKHWPELSLAITRALFDPQEWRDAQNATCAGRGDEDAALGKDNPLRAACEDQITFVDTLKYSAGNFVTWYLLPMLGSPDPGLHLAPAINWIRDYLDDVVGPSANPLRFSTKEFRNKVYSLLKNTVTATLGVDVDQVLGFVTQPSRWMCASDATTMRYTTGKLSLLLGQVRDPDLPESKKLSAAELFQPSDHARLDALMGLPPGHHVAEPGLSESCGRLEPSARFDPTGFAPLENTITQAKLLLLDGDGLNEVFGDTLFASEMTTDPDAVKTYQPGDNVMIRALNDDRPWLRSIDGDHAWRVDGLPRFCKGKACDPESSVPQPRAKDEKDAGTGHYPPWESCLLRPAFRTLFTDWELGETLGDVNFPAYGDAVGRDNLSDPYPPVIYPLAISGGTEELVHGVRYVPQGVKFKPDADDVVQAADEVTLSYRVYKEGAQPPKFKRIRRGGSFSLPLYATAGSAWRIDLRAQDRCGVSSETERFTVAED
jgi:hypothetical protein